MHRSGTSLLAKWMHEMGIEMGNNLLPAAFDNKNGFFEDQDFLNLHEDILRSNNLTNSGLIQDDKNLIISRYHQLKLKHLLNFKNELNQQWGWKEPRTCLFIKEYAKNLTNPCFLIVFRNPVEVIDSLLRRDYRLYLNALKERDLKGKLKVLLFKNSKLRKFIVRNLVLYSSCYNLYSENIFEIYDSLDVNNILAFNVKNIQDIQKKILYRLSTWDINYNKVDLGQIMQKNLMHAKAGFLTVEEQNLVEELTKTTWKKYQSLEEKFIHETKNY